MDDPSSIQGVEGRWGLIIFSRARWKVLRKKACRGRRNEAGTWAVSLLDSGLWMVLIRCGKAEEYAEGHNHVY